MKFSCTQENLNQGLSVVSHIAHKNINLPILGNVLIKSENKVLKLMTTNLEVAISCIVRGKVEEPGDFTVPSKLFSDYVSLLPNERVDISQEGESVVISCGSYQTKLRGIGASEFPLIPSIERKQTFTLNVNALRKAIGQVLFAVAPNESRPEISGVLFNFNSERAKNRLVLAATDSYRLAEKVIPLTAGEGTSEEHVAVIVPARTVAEIVRILGVFKDGIENPQDIQIAIGENQILFLYNNVEFVSRTIEGKYPDYRQLVPEKFETEVIVPKQELLRAVKTTSLFSKTGLNDITLRFTPEKSVHVSATNSQTGEHAVDLDGQVKGKENTVTVNFRYFLDGINNVETDSASLRLIDGMNPCIVNPVQNDPDYLYIVMPIRQ